MIDFIRAFFSEDGFMPHGHCYLWKPGVLWLHITSDALITTAYYSIPFTLVYFIRKRRDIPFNWMFLCFAIFIVACGTTHLMEIVVIYHPLYWLSGFIKAITAVVSVPTAILLVKLLPQALALPSPSALRAANEELAREIAERKRAEADIRRLNEELEKRVAGRTAELQAANETLVRDAERMKWLASFPERNPHPIIELDFAAGAIHYQNAAASRLFPDLPARGLDHPYLSGLRVANEALRISANRPFQREVSFGGIDYAQTITYVPESKRLRIYSTDISELKQAESQLKASLREVSDLKAALDEHAIVAITDPQEKITYVNDKLCSISKYSRAELVGQDHRIIDSTYHSEEFLRDLWTTIGSGKVWHGEIKNRAKDGSDYWVDTTIVPFLNEAGRPRQYVSIQSDITERKRAEQSLRKSQELLLSLVELAPVRIAMLNRNLCYIVASRLWTKAYGRGHENLAGLSHYELYPDLPESWKEAHQKGLAGEFLRKDEDLRIKPDGSKRWYSWAVHPWRDPLGEIGGIIISVEDITARKLAETTMQESERRFRTMANSIAPLAWIARADGFITWYNQRWYNYTGTVPEQMEGWGWQSVHDPEHLPEVMAQWQNAIALAQPFEMEFPLRGADGKFRRFLTRALPFKDETGRVEQWFGTNTDVEEIKRAEQEIKTLNTELEARVTRRTAELEAANKELEAFSYSVSHDLRAPLRAINGFAGIVLEDYGQQLPPDGRNYLERMRNGGLRMGELIDDLLAFARLSRQPLTRQPVDVTQLVRDVLTELNPSTNNHQVETRIGDLPVCQGDRALLKQVWTNLISNAAKYSRDRNPSVIEIGSENNHGETVYFVRDNGVGFDMQYAHKLFGVFQRLHRVEEFEGTGVGLAIVQRIIHRHGGRVWASAEPNRGATFYFTLEKGNSNGEH